MVWPFPTPASSDSRPRSARSCRSPPPIHFDDAADEPVSLVFLVLSPEESPELHLAILGEIARLVSDPVVREQLINAIEPDEMLGIIRQYRRQHTPFADARG